MPGKPRGLPKTGGRVKGTPNKFTANAREALEAAFEGIGGIPALIEWGSKEDNRGDFYRIWAKIIPQQVNHANSSGGPLPNPEVNVKLDLTVLSDDELRNYTDATGTLLAKLRARAGSGILPIGS